MADPLLSLASERIVTPNGIESGYLHIESGRISGLDSTPRGKIVDYRHAILMPGFVDIHVHGWGRGSFAWRGERRSLQAMSRDLVNAGVTAWLATSATQPETFLLESLSTAADWIADAKAEDGAEAVGIHMEGPFINPAYSGMQSKDAIQPPDIEGFKRYQHAARGNIRLMTLAPELPGALALIRYLRQSGVTVSAGHTDATFDETTLAIEAGLTHFTHAFSAMRGLHHREPGVVGALMYHQNTYAEVAKQSGITLRPEVFDILYRLKKIAGWSWSAIVWDMWIFPKDLNSTITCARRRFAFTIIVLKSPTTAERPERFHSTEWSEVCKLEMSFLDSVKNVVDRLEKGWVSAAQIACLNPAILAGVDARKGSLTSGKDADILVLGAELNLEAVWCRGVSQPLAK